MHYISLVNKFEKDNSYLKDVNISIGYLVTLVREYKDFKIKLKNT